VCAHLLKILKTWDGKKFVFKGSHSMVTACTLPEWLPADIIDTMNMEFGARLRKELVKFMQRTEIMRVRVHSTDTDRLSLDSIHRDPSITTDFWIDAFSHNEYED
jgi:hypothetical protein